MKINKYLNEISKIPLLTAEEEAELAKQARKWSEEALDTLVKANLRFVVSVAKQYQDQGLSLNDLINEGNIGLIKAAQRFDETRGFKLISFAVWWIRQSILQAIAEQTRIIRLPLNRIGEINKLDKVQQELRQILGYEATPEELAEALEMTTENVKWVLDNQKSRQHLSLDAPFKEWEEQTLLDRLDIWGESTDYNLVHTESIEIKTYMNTLNDIQKTVIELFFWLNNTNTFLSLDDIAKSLWRTRERIRQIKDKAIWKMRRTMKTKNSISWESNNQEKYKSHKKEQIKDPRISRNKWSVIIEDKKIDHKNIIISLREKYQDWVTIKDIYNHEHDIFWELLNYLYVHDTFLSDDEKSSIMLLYYILWSYKELDHLQKILILNNGLMQWLHNAIDIVNTIITRDNI